MFIICYYPFHPPFANQIEVPYASPYSTSHGDSEQLVLRLFYRAYTTTLTKGSKIILMLRYSLGFSTAPTEGHAATLSIVVDAVNF